MANKTGIMRLLAKGVSQSEVTSRLKCSNTTVSKCVQILREQMLGPEALTELDEASIRQSFFMRPERTSDEEYVTPDFETVCKRIESNRKLTLKEIWIQYSSNESGGKKLYSYSQFCRLFRDWSKKATTITKMRYVAGQVVFIDWAGNTGFTISRMTGRKQKVYMFVMCLPYSDIIYTEGFYSLAQEQWLAPLHLECPMKMSGKLYAIYEELKRIEKAFELEEDLLALIRTMIEILEGFKPASKPE